MNDGMLKGNRAGRSSCRNGSGDLNSYHHILERLSREAKFCFSSVPSFDHTDPRQAIGKRSWGVCKEEL